MILDKNMRYRILLFLLVAYQATFSQSVNITLYDRGNNAPLPFANLCFEEITTGKKYYRTSSENGIADNPIENRALIAISFVGYKTITDTVQPGVSKTYLMEQDLFNMEQVVVTGTRTPKRLADVPVQTTVITEADIKKAGAVSPMEILQDNIPGLVSSSNAMGNNMRIRGLNSRYILFLVDGERLVSEGAGGNINLDQIDFNTVERIEVVNGAASALYGSNAMGAVINIITKKPVHSFEGGISTSLQSHNTNKAQLNFGSNLAKTTLSASIFRNRTDGYDLPEGAMSKPHTDYGTDMKISYKPSPNVSIGLNNRLFQHELFNFPESMNAVHRLERKVTLGGNTSVSSANARNNLSASINFDKFYKYDVMERKDDQLEKQNDITHISSRMVNTYSSEERWEAVAGIEYNYEEISTDSSKILGPDPAVKRVGDGNIFAQYQYSFIEGFEGILGGRFTYNEQFGTALSPKLSLMFKTGKVVLRGGIGTAFRAPSLQELFYNFNHNGSFWVYGNPNLVPEKGLYNSLSVEYTRGSLNASLSGYLNQIRDKITSYRVISPLGQPDRYYTNVSSSTLQGIDFNISYVLLRQLVLKSTYSYCDARDNSTGLQLTSNVKHSATFALTWNGKVVQSPFSLQFTGRLTSPILNEYMETDEEGIDRTISNSSKSYNIWKATFIKPFRINAHLLEFTFKCDNIFNFSDVYFTNPGRQYLAGLRYKFR
jgi:outer membrane receptor for ferrienterochelin and colicins